MSDGLKNKTFHVLFWSFLERFGQQEIQFAISIPTQLCFFPKSVALLPLCYGE